ncbi:RidA family protein [Yersinia nurmii]|uniref:Endoribonuclease L-PSP n=1 Tax=Yersinia nurmii TaxID=685706 RepID=A0AAW7K2A0_9GAMM|nr:RidA family protein [Yersinia nurmii]MDN0088713.1 RidA family protein [Yersinia nurmii]CNE94807.1 endoribonuclease L-PSP [Yersinia nurmii]
MSDIQLINLNGNPPVGHYSHVACAGGLAYLSGQLPITVIGEPLTNQPFEYQVAQVFDNIDRVLASCGCDRRALIQVRVYLNDTGLWLQFNQLYANWLGEHRPARCVVPVAELHYGLMIEIEAIAQLAH